MSKLQLSQLAATILDRTGVQVAECYQCGKCTAGCPMATRMDLSPNQVVRLAQVGDGPSTERLLTSDAIWMCAGCLTCTQRCPKKLDPAAIMDVLRELSSEGGKVSGHQQQILKFHRSFLDSVEQTGRMQELLLVAFYKMRTLDLFSDVMLGPAMLARGKLPLIPSRIRGYQEVQRIFDSCRKRPSAQGDSR